MQEFFTAVGSFGFPIAISSYLLFRFEKKLDDLEKTNEGLVNEIRTLQDANKHVCNEVSDFKKKLSDVNAVLRKLK